MQNEKRLRGKQHNQTKTKLFERWASMHEAGEILKINTKF